MNTQNETQMKIAIKGLKDAIKNFEEHSRLKVLECNLLTEKIDNEENQYSDYLSLHYIEENFVTLGR